MNHPWRTVLAVRISRVERTHKSFPCHASEQLTIRGGILPHGRGVSRFSLCAPRGLRSPPKLGNQRVSGNEAVTGSEDRKLGTFHEFFDPAGPLSVGRRLTNFPGKRQLQADPPGECLSESGMFGGSYQPSGRRRVDMTGCFIQAAVAPLVVGPAAGRPPIICWLTL